MSDIKIKNINSIVATEILLSTYNLDILRYTPEQIEKLIELLNIILPSLPRLVEKSHENDINH